MFSCAFNDDLQRNSTNQTQHCFSDSFLCLHLSYPILVTPLLNHWHDISHLQNWPVKLHKDLEMDNCCTCKNTHKQYPISIRSGDGGPPAHGISKPRVFPMCFHCWWHRNPNLATKKFQATDENIQWFEKQNSLNVMIITKLNGEIIYHSPLCIGVHDHAHWNELNLHEKFVGKEFGIMGNGGLPSM